MLCGGSAVGGDHHPTRKETRSGPLLLAPRGPSQDYCNLFFFFFFFWQRGLCEFCQEEKTRLKFRKELALASFPRTCFSSLGLAAGASLPTPLDARQQHPPSQGSSLALEPTPRCGCGDVRGLSPGPGPPHRKPWSQVSQAAGEAFHVSLPPPHSCFQVSPGGESALPTRPRAENLHRHFYNL